MFRQAHAANQTLYTGDRGGSHYYDVLENSTSTEVANAWSGNVRPGQSDNLTAYVVNPFVKYGDAPAAKHGDKPSGLRRKPRARFPLIIQAAQLPIGATPFELVSAIRLP